MEEFILETPIVFIIFNRPESTQVVFNAIKDIKPTRLYVIADGPRSNVSDDEVKCKATRAVIDSVDWNCEVYTDYSEINLGCKKRVITGLDFVFSQENEAIILEDDCLPSQTFFKYCQDLLDKYADDKRVMSITGDNFQFNKYSTGDSYYFSMYPHSWGWATWRRAWDLFDEKLSLWPEIQKGRWLEDILSSHQSAKTWNRIFQDCYYQKNNAWDYVWSFTCWIQNGLTIIPNKNLVSNIGFGLDATHTKHESIFSNMRAENIEFPLKHPKFMIRNESADKNISKLLYQMSSSRETYLRKWFTAILKKIDITNGLNDMGITRVAIFGTLEQAVHLSKELQRKKIEVAAFLDNDSSKHGQVLNEVGIQSPTWLGNSMNEVNMVISTVLGEHEVDIIKDLYSYCSSEVRIISWMDLIAWNKDL